MCEICFDRIWPGSAPFHFPLLVFSVFRLNNDGEFRVAMRIPGDRIERKGHTSG